MDALMCTGRVAEAPERIQHGDPSVCRFTFTRNRYHGVGGGADAQNERKPELIQEVQHFLRPSRAGEHPITPAPCISQRRSPW